MNSVIGKYIFNDVITKVSSTIEETITFKWYNTTNGLYVSCTNIQITTSYMSYYYNGSYHDVYNFNTSSWLNEDCKEIDFGTGREEISDTLSSFITTNSTEPRMVLHYSNDVVQTANGKKIDTIMCDDVLYKIDSDDIKSNKNYTALTTIPRVSTENKDYVYNIEFNPTGGMSSTLCTNLTISQTESGVKLYFYQSGQSILVYDNGWKVSNSISVQTGIKDLNDDDALSVFNKVFVYFD